MNVQTIISRIATVADHTDDVHIAYRVAGWALAGCTHDQLRAAMQRHRVCLAWYREDTASNCIAQLVDWARDQNAPTAIQS